MSAIERLSVPHDGCGGELIHQYSTYTDDVFICDRCGIKVSESRYLPEDLYTKDGEMLFMI